MNFQELDLVILKTLTTNKKHALDFANDCDTKLFSPELWNAANLIVGYIKTYKDTPTLRVVVEKLAKGNNDRLIEHFKNVWEQFNKISYDDKEYRHDLEKIKKRFAEKQIVSIAEALSKQEPGKMDISKVLGDMQKTVQSIKGIDRSKTYEQKDIKEYLPTFVEKFNAKKENPNFEVSLKTKYSFLDYATNGLRPADFLLVAGESGFGKSLFLQNIAIQTWLQDNTINQLDNFTPGKNIVYFSLEMPYEDCFNRFLSRLSGVASRKIENASLDREEFAKVKRCLDFINKYPHKFIIVDISDACANDLDAILDDLNEQVDIVFIDYLGIMKTNEKSEEADWLKQGVVAYEVRGIGRRRNLPVASAVQLNRKTSSKASGKDSSENIGLSRLARSGTIATHATHVIQIENRVNEEQYPDFLYHIIKNRKGPKGKGILYKNLACATLIDKPSDDNKKDDDAINAQFTDVDDISKEIEKLEL